jgi:2-iminobutanoate/2-iminopropanoate deaminase
VKFHGSGVIGPGGRPLPLSSAIEAGGLLYLSGQLALRDGHVSGDITEQTGLVLDGIEGVLQEAGLTLDHVLKATVWLTDPQDFAGFNAVYSARLAPPYPVRSCVVSALLAPEARVEIEVVASRETRQA